MENHRIPRTCWWAATLEHHWAASYKVKHMLTTQASGQVPGIYLGWVQTCPHKDPHINVCSSFIHIGPDWNIPTVHKPVKRWSEVYLHNKTRLCGKRNGLLICATTWVNLRIIVWSERSSTQRLYIVWCHLCDLLERPHYTIGIRLVRGQEAGVLGVVDRMGVEGERLGWWKLSLS